MALDQTSKRRNIASKMVVQATALLDAYEALKILGAERNQAGTFVDDDFVGDLAHVTPTDVQGMFGTTMTQLGTVLEAANIRNLLLRIRK